MATMLYKIYFVFFLSCITYCTCASLSKSNDKPSSFGQDFTGTNNLQSWNDWLAKRGLGASPWDMGEFSGDKYQQWRDWMNKRGFALPGAGFGNPEKSMYQEWKDWMSKRNLGGGAAFPRLGDLGKSQFQQWSDWMVKRGFDRPSEGFGPGLGDHGSYQDWSDFVKRQSFIFPSSDLGAMDKSQYQNWQDWVKRMGPSKPGIFGGYNFGNKDNLMNWEDIYKKRAHKRQLGYAPKSFGSFRDYFTDGLQDWRSTFKGSKRGKSEESDQKTQEQ